MIVFPICMALLSAVLLLAVRRHSLDVARIINAATFRILSTGKSAEATDEMRAELLFHLEEELFDDLKSFGPQRAAWDSALRAFNLLLNAKVIRQSYSLDSQSEVARGSIAALNRAATFFDPFILAVTLLYLLSMILIAVDYATKGIIPGIKAFEVMTYAFIASQLPKLSLQLVIIALCAVVFTRRRLARSGWKLGRK